MDASQAAKKLARCEYAPNGGTPRIPPAQATQNKRSFAEPSPRLRTEILDHMRDIKARGRTVDELSAVIVRRMRGRVSEKTVIDVISDEAVALAVARQELRLHNLNAISVSDRAYRECLEELAS